MSRKLDKLNETLALTKAGSREHTAAAVARARHDLGLTKKTTLWISAAGPGFPVLLGGKMPFVYLVAEPKEGIQTRALEREDVIVYLPGSWGEGALFDAIRNF